MFKGKGKDTKLLLLSLRNKLRMMFPDGRMGR
jgi:hypothetical protein